MTTEYEGLRKQTNTEVCVLFKECTSYVDEIRMTSDYVKRQETMNVHLENQVTTWKEESRAILFSATSKYDSEMRMVRHEMNALNSEIQSLKNNLASDPGTTELWSLKYAK